MVIVLTPVAAFVAPSAAAGEEPADFGSGTYSGQASADGIRATLGVRDYLIIEDFVDGGGPSAQAALDSLGESTAFSSLPYPGATGIAFPGLIATLSGKSVPGYPFYVSSQNPSNPNVTVRQPGYLLHAESSGARSAARTEAGASTTTGDEFGSFSTAAVNFADGTITSLGEARTRLALGAFVLNGAVSRAQITRTPDGQVVKTSSFEASSIRLGALQIGVTDKGLVLGPQGTQLDSGRQVAESVTQSGVTVKFLPAVETADSVLSSGLEISTIQPVPNVGNSKGVVSYIVGRTFAQAESAGFSDPASGGDTFAPAAGVNSSAPVLAPAAAVGTGLDGAGAPGAIPGALPGAAAGNSLPAAAGDQVPTVDLVNGASLQRPLTEISFYPLLAALVSALLIGALAARRFG